MLSTIHHVCCFQRCGREATIYQQGRLGHSKKLCATEPFMSLISNPKISTRHETRAAFHRKSKSTDALDPNQSSSHHRTMYNHLQQQ